MSQPTEAETPQSVAIQALIELAKNPLADDTVRLDAARLLLDR